jgi:hypothetical protein
MQAYYNFDLSYLIVEMFFGKVTQFALVSPSNDALAMPNGICPTHKRWCAARMTMTQAHSGVNKFCAYVCVTRQRCSMVVK